MKARSCKCLLCQSAPVGSVLAQFLITLQTALAPTDFSLPTSILYHLLPIHTPPFCEGLQSMSGQVRACSVHLNSFLSWLKAIFFNLLFFLTFCFVIFCVEKYFCGTLREKVKLQDTHRTPNCRINPNLYINIPDRCQVFVASSLQKKKKDKMVRKRNFVKLTAMKTDWQQYYPGCQR